MVLTFTKDSAKPQQENPRKTVNKKKRGCFDVHCTILLTKQVVCFKGLIDFSVSSINSLSQQGHVNTRLRSLEVKN